MGFPVCIFDFKNDYAERSFVQANGLKVHDVRRHGIPFNPLMPSASEDGQAQPIEHIFTITGVLKRVFGLGDRQTATLRDAMKEAFERQGINPQRWVDADRLKPPSFDEVVAILEEQKEAKNPQAISLLDRIAPLFELGLFPATDEQTVPFEAMLDERLVLSLFALPTDEIKAALAELIIIRLHGVLLRRSQPRKLTRLLVLDEAWRVAHSTHLENLAREGRAFGAGIAIGTQYPGDLPPDLSGALDTKIYLKNQQPDHKKAVVRALCGANTRAGSVQSAWRFWSGLTQFEGHHSKPAISALCALQAHSVFLAAGTHEGRVIFFASPSRKRARRFHSGCFFSLCGFASTGSQMLILCVSGIRKRASTKHTAGTTIG